MDNSYQGLKMWNKYGYYAHVKHIKKHHFNTMTFCLVLRSLYLSFRLYKAAYSTINSSSCIHSTIMEMPIDINTPLLEGIVGMKGLGNGCLMISSPCNFVSQTQCPASKTGLFLQSN